MKRPPTDLRNLTGALDRLRGGQGPTGQHIDSEKWLAEFADTMAETIQETFAQIETGEGERIVAEDAAEVAMLTREQEVDSAEIEELGTMIQAIPPGEQSEKVLRRKRWGTRIVEWLGWLFSMLAAYTVAYAFVPQDWGLVAHATAAIMALAFIPVAYSVARSLELVGSRQLLIAVFIIGSLLGLAAGGYKEVIRGIQFQQESRQESVQDADIELNLPPKLAEKDSGKVPADPREEDFYERSGWSFTTFLSLLTFALLLITGGARCHIDELTRLIGVAAERSRLIERRVELQRRLSLTEGRLAQLGENRRNRFRSGFRRDIELTFWPRLLERRDGKRKWRRNAK